MEDVKWTHNIQMGRQSSAFTGRMPGKSLSPVISTLGTQAVTPCALKEMAGGHAAFGYLVDGEWLFGCGAFGIVRVGNIWKDTL